MEPAAAVDEIDESRATGDGTVRAAFCANEAAGTPTTKRLPTAADARKLVAPVMLVALRGARSPPTCVYDPETENFISRVKDLVVSLSMILISSR